MAERREVVLAEAEHGEVILGGADGTDPTDLGVKIKLFKFSTRRSQQVQGSG